MAAAKLQQHSLGSSSSLHACSKRLTSTYHFVCASDLSNIVCSSHSCQRAKRSLFGTTHDVAACNLCLGKLLTSGLQLAAECEPASVLVVITLNADTVAMTI